MNLARPRQPRAFTMMIRSCAVLVALGWPGLAWCLAAGRPSPCGRSSRPRPQQLAAVARRASRRHQPRNRPAGHLERRRETIAVAAAAARPGRLDAGRLGQRIFLTSADGANGRWC